MFKFHTVTTLIQKIIIGNVEQFRQLFQQESPLSSDYLATALQIATIFDNPEIVQILLQSGADPNLPTNSFKSSSFKCSLKWSSYNVIDLLFKAKPTNLDHVDANGLTMLDWAAVEGNTERLKKLLELGASTRNALNFAAMNNQIEAINFLLNAGVDVNQKVPSGFTPLMCAANKGFNQSCSLLLSRGAKVNDIAKAGTALLNAIKEGHYETCKLLLVAGADPNLQSPEEKITPFLCSVHTNHPDISLLLLEYGANKNTPSADFAPLTACQLHQFPGYTKVIQELNLSITDIANGDYFKLTKLIAHACKIEGTSAYKSGETFDRLGIAGTYLPRINN